MSHLLGLGDEEVRRAWPAGASEQPRLGSQLVLQVEVEEEALVALVARAVQAQHQKLLVGSQQVLLVPGTKQTAVRTT